MFLHGPSRGVRFPLRMPLDILAAAAAASLLGRLLLGHTCLSHSSKAMEPGGSWLAVKPKNAVSKVGRDTACCSSSNHSIKLTTCIHTGTGLEVSVLHSPGYLSLTSRDLHLSQTSFIRCQLHAWLWRSRGEILSNQRSGFAL
jgi:hypothetical protein